MTAAVVENGQVVNMISILPENMSEFPNAIDPMPWGLTVGDYTFDGEIWYREIDGEAVKLPLPEPEPITNEYEEYYKAVSAAIGGTE